MGTELGPIRWRVSETALMPHSYHRNDPAFKMGSSVRHSHFCVSLIVTAGDGRSHKTVSTQATTFGEEVGIQGRIKPGCILHLLYPVTFPH